MKRSAKTPKRKRPRPAASATERPQRALFRVLLRDRQKPESSATAFDGEAPEDALRSCIEADVTAYEEPIITWRDRSGAVALDFDRPAADQPVIDVDMARYFPTTLPCPLAAWTTHGGGLRAVFVAADGVAAQELSAAWALLSPLGNLVGWRLEAKTDSRHPSGERDGGRCGRVHWFAPTSHLVVPGDRTRSAASEAQVAGWLAERGLTFGRYTAQHCPWCGGRPSGGSPPVLISESGLRCFRCDRHESWDQLVGNFVSNDRPSLWDAAKECVHFPHERYVLRQLRPSLPQVLVAPAWRMIMRTVHAATLAEVQAQAAAKLAKSGLSDAEIHTRARAAAESHLTRLMAYRIDVVRSVGGAWLDEKTLQTRNVAANRTLKEMPWSAVSGTRKDAALAGGPLAGFVALAPINCDAVIGPYVEAPPGSIFVRRQRRTCDPPPLDVGDTAPSRDHVERAWGQLEQEFPDFPRGYFCGLVAARFIAQRCIGEPPIPIVTGDTGSGKTAIQHLAGAAVGAPAGIITFDDTVRTLRQFGLRLERGDGFLFMDEVSRVPKLWEKLEAVLRLNSEMWFEVKYANERSVPLTAPVSLLGSALPYAILRAPELSRRAAGWRLSGREKHWRKFGDLAHARRNEHLRSLLDIIVADVWWTVHALGPSNPDWRSLCFEQYDAVHLRELDTEDEGGVGTDEAIRALYAYFRLAPVAEFTTGARWSGWLDASPGTKAAPLLSELVDFEGEPGRVGAEMAELGRLDLAKILGFERPPLQLLVRKRSGKWLVKFVEKAVKKGGGGPRSGLPPIGGPSPRNAPACAPPKAPEKQNETHVVPDARDAHGATSEEAPPPADHVPGGMPCPPVAGGSSGATGATGTSATQEGFSALTTPGATEEPPEPLDAIVMDIETRSLAKLEEVGGRLYSAHRSTEIICLVAKLPSLRVVTWWPGEPQPAELIAAVEAGHPVVAHNVMGFDRFVWEKAGLPIPARWIDSVHAARAAGLPGKLGEIGQVLFGRGKDEAGQSLTLGLSRPDKRTGKLPPIDIETRRRVVAYCQDDVELLASAWTECLVRFAALEPDVRAVDAAINERGFAFDAALAGAIIQVEEKLGTNRVVAAPVEASTLASHQKLKAWLACNGIDVPDVRRGTLERVLADPDLPDATRSVIIARIRSSRVTSAKLEAALRSQSPDGRIRDSFAYHAAHTGRWAGRRFQPQNLPRGVKDLDIDRAVDAVLRQDLAALETLAREVGATVDGVLSSLVRPCIVAANAKLLGVADYASVEARVLLWLARDEDGLAVYRRPKGDAYVEMAARLFGIPEADVTKEQRRLGKSATLGCGYQLGAPTFRLRAEAEGVDWTALPVTPEQTVEAWRDAHPRIAGYRTGDIYKGHVLRRGGLWHDLEGAVRSVIETGRTVEAGRCEWARDGQDVVCTLPSGRRMIYRDAHIELVRPPWGGARDGITYFHGTTRTRVSAYGGKLTENITQAASRDLQAGAMVQLELAGLPVVLHVHDETVCELTSAADLERMKVIIQAPPTWASGLPIAVTGFVTQRYRKE